MYEFIRGLWNYITPDTWLYIGIVIVFLGAMLALLWHWYNLPSLDPRHPIRRLDTLAYALIAFSILVWVLILRYAFGW